ncbi:MAG: hypothetical protein ACRDL5_01850 [Solirubrobacteraceae bacterium]
MRRYALSILVAATCAGALAGVAVAGTAHWVQLRSVTVTLANGSLPPPFGRPHTTRFTTAHEVSRATMALNANRIAPRKSRANNGCVGGYNVTIVITRRHFKRERLTGYRCAGKTFGAIAGNVPGFLHALGLRAP